MSPRGRNWHNETNPSRRYYRRHASRAPRTPSLFPHTFSCAVLLLLLSLVLLIAGYSLLAGILAAVGGVLVGTWLGRWRRSREKKLSRRHHVPP